MIVIIFHNRIKSNQLFFTQPNLIMIERWNEYLLFKMKFPAAKINMEIWFKISPLIGLKTHTHTHIYRINDQKIYSNSNMYLTLYSDSDLLFDVKMNISCNGKQPSGRTGPVEIYNVVCVCV